MTTEEKPDSDQSAEKASRSGTDGGRSPATRKRTRSSSTTSAGSAKTRPAGAKGTKGSSPKTRSPRSGAAKGKRPVKEAPAAEEKAAGAEPRPLPRLLARFRQEISPALVKEFGYTSPMQVPHLSKVVLNIGLGEALENSKAIESATGDLTLITGQRPITTRARKSIAGFKIREGMAIGLSVTLRGRRMYEFFDRLISSSLPRIRDFRGVSRDSFDGRGNYSLGIREQIIFPEIDYNSIDRIRGLQVAMVTTAATDREGLSLLEMLGVPFAPAGSDSRAA
jgi:large subunit ribosomal protein L5